jgi:hypothetical protein
VVEVGADGARGQLEPTGDLLVRPPFEIVQQHHLALRLGELRQCRDDPVAKLAALQLRGGGFFAGQLVQLKRLGRSDRVMPDQVTGRLRTIWKASRRIGRDRQLSIRSIAAMNPSWQASSASASLRVTASAMARQARKYRSRSRSAARPSPARTRATSAASVSSMVYSLTRETGKVLS